MIYTITLNPAIDHVIETKGFNINQTNYYNHDYTVIGGKGINVGVVLNELKADVLVTGIIGTKNKEIFISKFDELNLKNDFLMFNGQTRTNFKIKNLSKNQETELNGLGGNVSQTLITDLLYYLEENIKENDIVIASGSIPQSINNDIYFKIGEIINKKRGIYILDTSKEQMLEGLRSHPFLIKPNLSEIAEILNQEYREYNLDEIKIMISKLRTLGARNVLLSLGSQGSYYFDENDSFYKVGIANGKLVNSVGSGDSMIAGFAYGLYKNLTIEETLQYGSASGSATAFVKWLGSKEQIEKFIPLIKIEKLS